MEYFMYLIAFSFVYIAPGSAGLLNNPPSQLESGLVEPNATFLKDSVRTCVLCRPSLSFPYLNFVSVALLCTMSALPSLLNTPSLHEQRRSIHIRKRPRAFAQRAFVDKLWLHLFQACFGTSDTGYRLLCIFRATENVCDCKRYEIALLRKSSMSL